MSDLYDIQREKITKKCFKAIINNDLSLLTDMNIKNDYYNNLIDFCKTIIKLQQVIQNSSTGELIISDDKYSALINDIFGGDV